MKTGTGLLVLALLLLLALSACGNKGDLVLPDRAASSLSDADDLAAWQAGDVAEDGAGETLVREP